MENRRSKMTKRLIKESLTELLETENLNSISVRMICERADLNRSTFYLHYETLDDLLSEFTEELMSSVWKNDTAFIREQDIPQMIEWALAEANPVYPVPVVYDEKRCEKVIRRIMAEA